MAEDLKSLCTVLVASCDKYKDVLKLFAELWKKHWHDCPFEVVLVTETDADDCGIFSRVITCGSKLSWCEMMAQALQQIKTPYLMLLMDDYFLTEPVDTKNVLFRFEQMRMLQSDCECVILNSSYLTQEVLGDEKSSCSLDSFLMRVGDARGGNRCRLGRAIYQECPDG